MWAWRPLPGRRRLCGDPRITPSSRIRSRSFRHQPSLTVDESIRHRIYRSRVAKKSRAHAALFPVARSRDRLPQLAQFALARDELTIWSWHLVWSIAVHDTHWSYIFYAALSWLESHHTAVAVNNVVIAPCIPWQSSPLYFIRRNSI